METARIAVVPVGKVSPEEVEGALTRASRVLRRPLELKAALELPQGIENRERGQFRAATLMTSLRASFARLGPGKMVGSGGDADTPHSRPDAIVFVTDVDLYTANSDSVFTALLGAKKLGVVSLRRVREAFYRRSADPAKQRSRLTKEVIRAVARLCGMPECSDMHCVLSPSNLLVDLDLKKEKLCRACSQRMFQGTIRL